MLCLFEYFTQWVYPCCKSVDYFGTTPKIPSTPLPHLHTMKTSPNNKLPVIVEVEEMDESSACDDHQHQHQPHQPQSNDVVNNFSAVPTHTEPPEYNPPHTFQSLKAAVAFYNNREFKGFVDYVNSQNQVMSVFINTTNKYFEP